MNAKDLFTELGRRLRGFGDDARSQEAIRQACAANGWFAPHEVVRAVSAIRDRMLQPELLDWWLAHYPAPGAASRRVLVVMAGNIPLVGFFDLLCVVSAGHECLIKPSSKDRVLMEYVVALLLEIDPSAAVGFYREGDPVDAVIATGGDNAVRHFRMRYAGIPTLLRGHRQSVAVLSGRETAAELAGLADDIWAYSGLGCRNVSLVWMPEQYRFGMQMPPVDRKYRNNYLRERALLTMTGQPFVDLGAAVAVEQREFPVALSRIACARYRSLEEVVSWLAEHDEEVQCVVSGCVSHSRRADFGCAQSPGLTDYPDDRDTMAWLAGL